MTDEGKLRDAAADLISALQWLVDDLTDAEEDRNPETGDEYDSVANVRSVLAKARIIHGFGAGAVGVSSCFHQAGAVCIKRLRQ
jgi:hypothetical protein